MELKIIIIIYSGFNLECLLNNMFWMITLQQWFLKCVPWNLKILHDNHKLGSHAIRLCFLTIFMKIQICFAFSKYEL